MAQFYDILKRHIIFSNLSDGDMNLALSYFNCRIQKYKKSEFLHHAGDELLSFGIVLSGTVHVYSDDIEGHQMMMANVLPGDSFGESLCFLKIQESPVYICAALDCEVLWLSPERLHDISQTDFEHDMKNRFISDLAVRALSMNRRVQILSKHSLREKLITFFTDYVRRSGTAPFAVPFDRSGMAIYLGADRSALSRELAAMKKEGIIDYNKNIFRFLNLHQNFD